MLRKIKIIADVSDHHVLAEDMEMYGQIQSSSNEEMLKHILFAGLTHHFNIPVPEIVYTTNEHREIQRLYGKLNDAFQSIDYWHQTHWTKIDLRYFLNPHKIIYNILLREYLGDLSPDWGWVIMKDTKDQWGWSPFSYSQVEGERRIAKYWLSNFSKPLLEETIDDFFALIDYKINDILVFTMASFVELWSANHTLRDDWSHFLLDENRLKQVKRSAYFSILELQKAY